MLLNENEKVVPYEVTFSTMGAQESREWGEFLKLPDDVRKLLGQYDLTFFLLGKEYLRAIALPETFPGTQAYIFLTALAEIKNIPQTKNLPLLTNKYFQNHTKILPNPAINK